MLALIAFSFGGGFYANTGEGGNYLVQAISYVSPIRYTTELLLGRVVAGKEGGEELLEQLGLTWGFDTCIYLLIAFTLACFTAGWIILLYVTRKY